MAENNYTKKLLGYFIKFDESDPGESEVGYVPITPPTPANDLRPRNTEPIDDLKTTRLGAPPNAPVKPAETVPPPDQLLTLEEIYRRANITPASFTAEEVWEFLQDQPASADTASLTKDFARDLARFNRRYNDNVDAKSIARDAVQKQLALQHYIQTITNQTDDFSAERNRQIADLEKQIEQAREAIKKEQERRNQSIEKFRIEAERLDKVVKFLDQDVSA
jgi:hypothetical protein